VEAISGQTGVVIVPSDGQSLWTQQNFPVSSDEENQTPRTDSAQITNRVLGVVQLATSWESNTKDLMQDIKSLSESLGEVKGAISKDSTLDAQAPVSSTYVSDMTEISNTLEESLKFLLRKTNTVLWNLEYIHKRAVAQMTAVSPSRFSRD
jgi:hypothetical protein